ncbi:uncharacterized protein LOC117746630 [Cyclopterus lumpus]|uniref:uncharacterized protein LOC117746630 n=1 Tax=Cyclopterus lumpus TaxID=8103 RepID=UPI00148669C0|nr:uncharacterized protein LOC117746630 [Cyclopterus lumpus]
MASAAGGDYFRESAVSEMDAIFNILEQFRLESSYNLFVQLGVTDVRDEDLNNIGLSHVEKNRFSSMRIFIQRLAALERHVQPVQKSLELFTLQYSYPKCPQPIHINDMDPAVNTVEDLMLRIGHLESVGHSKGVCLYTVDGMPLTDDPFFNTWSLKDRHIQHGSVIYAIFTPKENLKHAPQIPKREVGETCGDGAVRCHVMLKGDYEVTVNLASDTITSLRLKLANESGIPTHVLHYKYLRKVSIMVATHCRAAGSPKGRRSTSLCPPFPTRLGTMRLSSLMIASLQSNKPRKESASSCLRFTLLDVFLQSNRGN